MPDKRLIVIGDGPDFEKIKRLAPPNVTLLGHQPFEVLVSHLQQAKAFIFAAEEDFGIAPLEAQACGTPVIAYGKGGALETIKGLPNEKAPTGLFFPQQTVDAICQAMMQFEQLDGSISPADCRENALRFSQERFCSQFTDFVTQSLDAFQSGLAQGAR